MHAALLATIQGQSAKAQTAVPHIGNSQASASRVTAPWPSQLCLFVLHRVRLFACHALPAIPIIPDQAVSWTPTLVNGPETVPELSPL